MEIWNMKELAPPPITSCTLTLKEIDIRLLQITLRDGINFFKSQQHLFTEAALLSRCIYRFKMKFRSSKDFKAVEKLSHILRTYLQMDICSALKYLLNCVPHKYELNETYVLTKNTVDFVLVRMQGLGKILSRILEHCKITSKLTYQRLRLGHFWKIAVVIYALTARIFVITKSIFKFVCELYTNLLPFSRTLCNSGVQWLPENYVFPDRLEGWLNIDWLELNNTVIEISDDEPEFSYFNLIDDSDDDVEFCDEYIVINDDSSFSKPRNLNESLEFNSCNEVLSEINSEIQDDTAHVNVTTNVDNIMPPMPVTNVERSQTSKQLNNSQLEGVNQQCSNNEEVDVGEVIDLSKIGKVTQSMKKRNKRRKKSNKINISSLSERALKLSSSKFATISRKQNFVPAKKKKRNSNKKTPKQSTT